MKSIKRFFSLSEYYGDDAKITARLIFFISVTLILASLVFVAALSFVAPELTMRVLILALVAISTNLVVLWLIRHHRLRIAGILLTALIWLVITVASIRAGGVSAPIFIGYMFLIILGGVLSRGGRGALYVTLICIGSGILIAYAESNGTLSEVFQYSPYARIAIYFFFFILAMTLQNVTARNLKDLLANARSSEKKYRSLLENIPITTYINSTDSHAYTEYVSPQVSKLVGYPRDDFMKDREFWKKIIHPDDRDRVLEKNEHTVETGEPFEAEYRLITNDQRVIWVRDEATLVYDEAGKPLHWLGVWTDITSRKMAEEEQAELISVMTKRTIQLQTGAEVSRAASSILDIDKLLPMVVELIRSHFDYYYVGIFLLDDTQGWAVLSAATGEMGKRLIALNHRLEIGDSSMIGWCISHGQARIALDVGEDAVRFRNPLLPLTRSEMALPLISRGEVIGAMSIQSEHPSAFSSVDITALQAMSDQVCNAIKNARLFTERANLITELEVRNAELERFTYTVSHDLKSPLVTIRGFLGYIREDAITGDMTRFDKDLNRIANAADRMQSLLNDLLELSRIGRIINKPEDIPFEQLVREAMDLVIGPSEENTVAIDVHKDLPIIHGDHPRLVEVIQNLLTNAIKFMGSQPTPRIVIGLRDYEKDGRPIFFIKDNGIGIEAQYHERIFGLFNRLDPSVSGTGIGLTLVRRIIEVHGGRIWVESEPGKGATFLFTLPLAKSG
jgi:PAS domain S-box-containing protein